MKKQIELAINLKILQTGNIIKELRLSSWEWMRMR
jgi:hypothetical protein